MKPSLVLFTAITLLLPVGLASHGIVRDPTNTNTSRIYKSGAVSPATTAFSPVRLALVSMDGQRIGALCHGCTAHQSRAGEKAPAISRSTSEPTGDAIPHPQPNCVCDLRNTGGVAGFGSDHGWSASKASIRSLAHASLGLGSAEFYLAYKDNDVAGMKDAALAMGIDLAAAVIPFIPGGAGIALKAAKKAKKAKSAAKKKGGKKKKIRTDQNSQDQLNEIQGAQSKNRKRGYGDKIYSTNKSKQCANTDLSRIKHPNDLKDEF